MIVRAPTTTIAPSSAEDAHTLTHNTETRAHTHTNTETKQTQAQYATDAHSQTNFGE